MSDLELVQRTVAGRMEQIVDCFKPGVKITVLVRSPGFPNRDFLMTADDLDEVISAVDRRKAAGKTT